MLKLKESELCFIVEQKLKNRYSDIFNNQRVWDFHLLGWNCFFFTFLPGKMFSLYLSTDIPFGKSPLFLLVFCAKPQLSNVTKLNRFEAIMSYLDKRVLWGVTAVILLFVKATMGEKICWLCILSCFWGGALQPFVVSHVKAHPDWCRADAE